MQEEFETEHTENPVCPFCGHEHDDAWDWGGRDIGDYVCNNCEKIFKYVRHIEIYYYTSKPKEK